MSRLSHFLDSQLTDGGEVVSLTRRPPFTPQEDFWYSFLLEAESTPSHSAAGTITSIEKFSDLIGNRTGDLPACSTVPQSTTYRLMVGLLMITEMEGMWKEASMA
jgi:hypothetical protein